MTTKNIREALLLKAGDLEAQAKKIQDWVESADQSGFKWSEVNEDQVKSIEMILKVKLDRQER